MKKVKGKGEVSNKEKCLEYFQDPHSNFEKSAKCVQTIPFIGKLI